jgi:hypothetical protein
MSDISPSNPAATMAAGDQHCYLLTLPVETLQHITGHLDVQEVVPALRQTCRSLESIAFDQFTKGSFGTIKCCIFYEESWQNLKDLLSRPACITSKIRVMHFTTSFFHDKSPATMQLARNKTDGNHFSAQAIACETYSASEGVAIRKPLNIALVARVFHDLKHVFPHILLDCDMGDNQGPPFEHLSAHRDTLLTMIATQSKFARLMLSHTSLWGLDEFFLHLGPQVLHATADLEQFELSFYEQRGSNAPPVTVLYNFSPERLAPIHAILRTSKKLSRLYLDMGGFDIESQQRDFVQTALQATASRAMQCLSLEETEIKEEDLLKALSGWASTLEQLALVGITLISVREGWSAVLRIVSTMPKLTVFKMCEPAEMTAAAWPRASLVCLSHFTKGIKAPLFDEAIPLEDLKYGREYEGRAEIVSGLEELLARPLTYEIV